MFSFLSSYNQARSQRRLLKAQASIMRANARGTRNRANTQAAAIEHTAQQNQLIAAHNLATARTNQREKTGAAKAIQASSGFTNQDSGTQTQQNIQQELDQHIANMALSASVALTNAWQQAADTRRQGEITAYAQEAQANQYQMQAKAIQKAANLSLAIGIVSSAIGAYKGYNAANAFNTDLNATTFKANAALTNAYGRGEISWDTMQQGLTANATAANNLTQNPITSAILQSSHIGNIGYHTTAAFSPFISSYSTDANARKNNWGGMLSVLTGNVPYKIPSAGTIFSNYI